MEGPLHRSTWDDLVARIGSEIGVSGWVSVDQPMIDAYARVSGDGFYLHTDPARAAALPFGGTIAHGLLTLSLLPPMSYEVCPFLEGARYPLNYGFNRLRFVAPVPVNSRVRAHFVLHSAEFVGAQQRQLRYDVTMEIGGRPKPALVAEWLTRFVM
jgi:acyl dehydratase